MTNHTPEPWSYSGLEIIGSYADDDVRKIANLSSTVGKFEIEKANARRIVACVNACKGLSNEDLENGALFSAAGIELFGENNEIKILSAQVAALISQRDKMLSALKGVVRVADRDTDEFNAARAAIASAEVKE